MPDSEHRCPSVCIGGSMALLCRLPHCPSLAREGPCGSVPGRGRMPPTVHGLFPASVDASVCRADRVVGRGR
jgi:hypothetical protein